MLFLGQGVKANWRRATLCGVLLFNLASRNADSFAAVDAQWSQYDVEAPKTVLELQPLRQSETAKFTSQDGTEMSATLINLNPHINAWFILRLEKPAGGTRDYHLQNPEPELQQISLEAAGLGLRLERSGRSEICPLLLDASVTALEEAARTSLPDAPLCGERMYLRDRVPGTYTNLERVTNFLRDHLWGGERIIGFVRKEFYQDAFIEHGDARGPVTGPALAITDGPADAALESTFSSVAVRPESLGIALTQTELKLGHWYPVPHAPGIFLSAIFAKAAAHRMPGVSEDLAAKLDPVEQSALDYLVAFDLSAFSVGFEVGTDHPRVDWSERVRPSMRDERLPGPDGIGTVAPVVLNGIVPPWMVPRTVATFAGGFKREHGAFRYGLLAERNHGSHYGFLEQGVILSKLQPGLATLWADAAGNVGMKTWGGEDLALLPQLKEARQNGVPLLETGSDGQAHPGVLINQWGAGNWSGSADEKLRTVRSGACLQVVDGRRFLIYGYFSAASPNAMAAVFLAYHCRYAMHLDMNALEHTYLALYVGAKDAILVQHLVEGMSAVDKKGGNRLAPRFLGFPDDRDFFYVFRTEAR